MKLTHFYIERPIFATVISTFILLFGALAFINLPIQLYPDVMPPTIQVSASYPGASSETIAKTVATPLEQEINGVEGMLYMYSQSTSDGQLVITVTFKIGTDMNQAQVLVQNRVATAAPRLPEEVRRLGVITKKNAPDIMMVVALYSPNGTYDQTYMGNYATLHVLDKIRRIDGVGEAGIFGGSEYAMRVWLDPSLIQSYGITTQDIVQSLRAENVQVASGTLNQAPQPKQGAFELKVETLGRLTTPDQFENIVVKSGENGRIVYLRDVGRVELGTQNYATRGYYGTTPAVNIAVFQRPNTNALATADELLSTLAAAQKNFPPDLEYKVVYKPTDYVAASINEVLKTILEAVVLVVLVIIIFLQTWRASIIPIIAIPVSLIGTFTVMQVLGFSLNNLSLFGLVLAIGIVVDDAIVVVENMERNMRLGLSPREAAHKTMDEVGTALIAMGLVLVAVFLPTAFLEGVSGRFFQEFGLTIAVATVISVFVSLTLSPALAALIMRAHDNDPCNKPTQFLRHPVRYSFCSINSGLEKLSNRYGSLVAFLTRKSVLLLALYAGLMFASYYQFNQVPGGFIPNQDQGYLIVSIQLPPGASLERTDEVLLEATELILSTNGVESTSGFSGFSGATGNNAPNSGTIFAPLLPFKERLEKGIVYEDIYLQMQAKLSSIKDAFIIVIKPPPVRGVSNTGGFKMMIQDIQGRGFDVLNQATWSLAMAANQDPRIQSAFTFFENSTPKLFLDIDREKAQRLGVTIPSLFEALEVYLGTAFINDFNYLGRTFRVTAQADAHYRLSPEDVLQIHVRNTQGEMVPLGSVATVKDITGPYRVPRHNLFPAAGLIGSNDPGTSTGEVLDIMESLAEQHLPDGIGYEWTELAFQEKSSGNTAAAAFLLAVVFVFLLLAAQFESWSLPLSVILIVPMCLLSAITGIALAQLDNNILTQIGFIVLIALASKNAILIVEFASKLESEGKDRWQAAIEACKLRLRPILMTSFAFILGVLPLVIANGPGSEIRQALGISVFSGMIGVTLFGLLFTPVFYVLCRRFSSKHPQRALQTHS